MNNAETAKIANFTQQCIKRGNTFVHFYNPYQDCISRHKVNMTRNYAQADSIVFKTYYSNGNEFGATTHTLELNAMTRAYWFDDFGYWLVHSMTRGEYLFGDKNNPMHTLITYADFAHPEGGLWRVRDFIEHDPLHSQLIALQSDIISINKLQS